VVERLWGAGRAGGVIDLDELSLAHPSPGRSFALDNLRAVWPNYAAIPDLRLIIPHRHRGRRRTDAAAGIGAGRAPRLSAS
jgi:hypothetical protein